MGEELQTKTDINGDGPLRWEHVITRLMLVIRMRLKRQLGQFGLTLPQFFVLRSISSRGPECAMRELAQATHQFSATVTGIVDRLVRDGLAERHRDKDDRRLVLVSLTASGHELLDRVTAANRTMFADWLSRVGHDKARQFLDLLAQLLKTIEEDSERQVEIRPGDPPEPPR